MLPFATEEAWSWWHDGSVHATRGRRRVGRRPVPALDLDAVSEVLARVRRAKTEAKLSQRADGRPARRAARPPTPARRSRPAAADLADALTIAELDLVDGDALAVDVD